MVLLFFLVAVAIPVLYIFVRALIRHPKPSEWSDIERGSAIAIVTWVLSPIIALGIPAIGLADWASMAFAFMAVSSVGAFLAARYVQSAWCLAIPTSVLVPALWAFCFTSLWAFKSGWHGLDVQEVSGIDQGEGFGIALTLILYTVMAPFWGFVLGLLSHLYLRRRPDSAPA